MPSPDTIAVRGFLSRVERRTGMLAALGGAAVGSGLAAVLALLGIPSLSTVPQQVALGAGCMALGAAIRWQMARRNRPQLAHAVEARAPECHNLLITAHQLLASPNAARSDINALVVSQAAAKVKTLNANELFPGRRVIRALTATVSLWVVIVAATAGMRQSGFPTPGSLLAPSGDISGIEVTVTAPSYAARVNQSLRNPERIEVLAGSVVRLTVQANAPQVNIETMERKDTLGRAGNRTFAGNITADADGFIAVQSVLPDGGNGQRRLIGVTVVPDRAPRVRLVAPGRDLVVPDAKRTLALGIEADDDLGLATLKVRYTKVSGSGERFTFTEGEVPIAITRTDARAWKANGRWNLEGLGLEPGDMVVYRAVVSDSRPGAPPIESDSYFAEIMSVGSEAMAGFSIDPEEERYRLSQQMVVLKTERLIAARSTLGNDAYAALALELAAEQRRVRAEFVFMMGGELAEEIGAGEVTGDLNEEAEAEGEADILEGRLANQGRIALMRAIRAMSGAASLLTAGDVPAALVRERAALVQLERAFSHTRIILRALTVRERLDLTRRMTGVLTDAGRNTLPMVVADPDARVAAARAALAEIAELAMEHGRAERGRAERGRAERGRAERGRGEPQSPRVTGNATTLAERVLRIDASDTLLQNVSARLQEASVALSRSRTDEGLVYLDRAALALSAIIKSSVLTGPQRTRTVMNSQLDGAVSDALRATGRPLGPPSRLAPSRLTPSRLTPPR